MAEEKKGIELLQKLVKEVVELGKVADTKLDDGFQYSDLFAIAMEGKDLAFVFSNWVEVREQFDDLSVAEIKELVNNLVTELGFTDEEILELIEKSVEFAEAGYNLFVAIKAMKKEVS